MSFYGFWSWWRPLHCVRMARLLLVSTLARTMSRLLREKGTQLQGADEGSKSCNLGLWVQGRMKDLGKLGQVGKQYKTWWMMCITGGVEFQYRWKLHVLQHCWNCWQHMWWMHDVIWTWRTLWRMESVPRVGLVTCFHWWLLYLHKCNINFYTCISV